MRRKAVAIVTLATGAAAVVWFAPAGVGRDHARYHQRGFEVRAVSGEELELPDGTRVRLIGVSVYDHEPARAWLGRSASGVTLYLPDVGTRSQDGSLLAYAYAGNRLLNAGLVEQGLAFADRRWEHAWSASLAQGEADARRRRRGLWGEVDADGDPPMPAWRRAWRGQATLPPWERDESAYRIAP